MTSRSLDPRSSHRQEHRDRPKRRRRHCQQARLRAQEMRSPLELQHLLPALVTAAVVAAAVAVAVSGKEGEVVLEQGGTGEVVVVVLWLAVAVTTTGAMG